MIILIGVNRSPITTRERHGGKREEPRREERERCSDFAPSPPFAILTAGSTRWVLKDHKPEPPIIVLIRNGFAGAVPLGYGLISPWQLAIGV
jgi:hypothetical protein